MSKEIIQETIWKARKRKVNILHHVSKLPWFSKMWEERVVRREAARPHKQQGGRWTASWWQWPGVTWNSHTTSVLYYPKDSRILNCSPQYPATTTLTVLRFLSLVIWTHDAREILRVRILTLEYKTICALVINLMLTSNKKQPLSIIVWEVSSIFPLCPWN